MDIYAWNRLSASRRLSACNRCWSGNKCSGSVWSNGWTCSYCRTNQRYSRSGWTSKRNSIKCNIRNSWWRSSWYNNSIYNSSRWRRRSMDIHAWRRLPASRRLSACRRCRSGNKYPGSIRSNSWTYYDRRSSSFRNSRDSIKCNIWNNLWRKSWRNNSIHNSSRWRRRSMDIHAWNRLPASGRLPACNRCWPGNKHPDSVWSNWWTHNDRRTNPSRNSRNSFNYHIWNSWWRSCWY